MNIIHVLSHSIAARNPVFTGADKYVLDLAAAQVAAGHRVMLVGDHLAAPTPARFCRRPIGDRHPLDRIRNVAFLRRLARNLAADVVHGHSRAASWAAHFAVRKLGVAQISTVHGRQKLHLSTRGYDIYGDLIIAVCENVRDHLVEELGIDRHKIVVIPNGLQFPAVPATPAVPSSVGSPVNFV